MDGAVIRRASAPVRLDFAGGWTDVDPFASERGGLVVNAAIELRAEASVAPADAYELCSDDLGRTLRLATLAELEAADDLALHRAAVRLAGAGPCRVHTRSDAPPGSGLGSSGAIGVALVAALDAFQGRRPAPADVAERAWRVETVEAALPGGRQDQYAAALGGFHRLGFGAGGVTIEPLDVPPDVRAGLARHLVLCYTGQSRVSSATIERVMRAYAQGDRPVVSALHGLAAVADRMSDAVVTGDLARIGALLSENWRLQQELDAGMCTDLMRRLERAMRDLGSLGGKAAGAGAGGSMFFVLPGERGEADRLADTFGVTLLPVAWAETGVRTW